MRETCTSCRAMTPHLHLFQGQHFCDHCFQEWTIVCQYCNERVWNEDIHYSEGQAICPNCFNSCFLTCESCGRVIHENEAHYLNDDEDFPYCGQCYLRHQQKLEIHDYYYKPDPIFYGDGPRYLGVELEIDGAGEDKSHAFQILKKSNMDGLEHLYCKHDGSLDDGIELVSHPMALAYHEQVMPWNDVLQEAAKLGYRSHQADTCGLHVHVSRNAFGTTEIEQDAVIARILYFFEKHWNELLKFSRRTQYQLNRWAARYGYKEQPMEILDHAKKGHHGGRYTCVNLTNSDTIEFRIFRGTLKYNTLIATLQMVDRICDVALYLSDDEIKSMSWSAFVSGCTAPELVQYLKERRLYINDPVVAEEDL